MPFSRPAKYPTTIASTKHRTVVSCVSKTVYRQIASPASETSSEIVVGRTPWPAADALVGLLPQGKILRSVQFHCCLNESAAVSPPKPAPKQRALVPSLAPQDYRDTAPREGHLPRPPLADTPRCSPIPRCGDHVHPWSVKSAVPCPKIEWCGYRRLSSAPAVEGDDQSVGSTGSQMTKTRTGFPANSSTICSAAEAPCRHTAQVGDRSSRTLTSSFAELN
jgi:hypothetical protein